MSDDARKKRQAESGSLVSRMRRVVEMHCYERHFPVAPVSHGFLVYGWKIHEEAMIGFNEATSTLLFGDTITKTGPLLNSAHPKREFFSGLPSGSGHS